jgi:hypothetical protein
MPDEVWPVPAADRLLTFDGYNGFGFMLRGFTRLDGEDRCFATCWSNFAGLPVRPTERYYLSEKGFSSVNAEWMRVYGLHGRSRLRRIEVLRTYAYCWLVAPAIVLLPSTAAIVLAVHVSDALSACLLIGGLFCWPSAGVIINIRLLTAFRTRWTQARDVRWVDAPPCGRGQDAGQRAS